MHGPRFALFSVQRVAKLSYRSTSTEIDVSFGSCGACSLQSFDKIWFSAHGSRFILFSVQRVTELNYRPTSTKIDVSLVACGAWL